MSNVLCAGQNSVFCKGLEKWSLSQHELDRKALDQNLPFLEMEFMERNKGKLWLALRYLKGQGRGFIHRSHWLTIAGITLGVTALICVGGVMNGLRADIRNRVTSTLSEIRITARGGEAISGYQSLVDSLDGMGYKTAPVIRSDLVIKKEDQIFSTQCFGIDPKRHIHISAALGPKTLTSYGYNLGILEGDVGNLNFKDGGIALGASLATSMRVKVGDEIQLLSPVFDVPTAFGLLPRVRTMHVAAIFSTGMPDYDYSFSFVSLEEAGFFKDYDGEVDYIEVKTPDATAPEAHTKRIRKHFKDWKVEDWGAYDASLYSAIRFEKYLMFVIMLFMYVIASFNLTGSMLKTIAQKRRELGLLKAFGYRGSDLSGLFLRQALILSSLGIALGLIISTLLLLLQKRFELISMGTGDFGALPLPVVFSWKDYLSVVLASFGITLISVLLPLRRLKRINPIELIRKTT